MRIVKRTVTFSQGDLVKVPFPYTDQATWQYRPALVVSSDAMGPESSLVWVVMITSAAHRTWAGDVSLAKGFREVGLPAPSIIRTAKIATIEAHRASRIGKLDARRWKQVGRALRGHLGLSR